MQPLISQKQDLVEQLFTETQSYLAHFFDTLNLDTLRGIVDRLLECKGTIFLSGVGKSGIVAKKIAMTMNSCGIKAGFLSPLDALHGDIGVISCDDVVLLLSKSGETDELLNLCPALRNKGASIIAVVSAELSRLTRAADLAIVLPVAKELCPFDIAPTTSTTVQLIFGDLVAMALMRAKKVTIDNFVLNHPAGQIGKRLTLKVADLMVRGDLLPLCRPDERLVDVLVELSNKKCGCVLIVDEEKHLLGLFTDGDLRRALQKHNAEALSLPIEQLMTKTPRSISSEALAYDAMKEMEANQKGAITSLVVVEQGMAVGLIRLHDIIQSGL
ncbi:MAG: KpsF/GutQ family sugar-phosphate isomerase [Verrucomicrobia bacterium]|nr:KpsF/GutQ family sugar-phosphate isomerase [Verrucomicrobiota bacterium]MBS0637923.1 KpsF/GutQ family sugar-phosphate isomerase [Verrucomicrobiota bacterium]